MGAYKSIRGWSLALALCASALVGCTTTSEDIQHWANTKQGPQKLMSVVTHSKFPMALRGEAVLSLIGMPPRGGRRVGIDDAIAGLDRVQPPERERLMAHVVPGLVSKLTAPPPPEGEPDESVPFKDAAYAMLTEDDGKLVTTPEHRQQLEQALAVWAHADFERRQDAPGQNVGMRQMLALLGPQSLSKLPERITPDGNTQRLVSLIAELGDAPTRAAAAAKLVEMADFTASPAWLTAKQPELKKANEVSGIKADTKAFDAQLQQFQEEELLRLFASLKQLKSPGGAQYLARVAADPKRPEKQRAGALAALEGQVDGKDDGTFQALLSVAKATDTPDTVRTLAFRRLATFTYTQLAEPLYDTFGGDDWRVRWLAGELLLQKLNASQLDEFMSRLEKVEHMAVTEPLTYGKLLAKVEGLKNVSETVDSYSSSSNETPVRLAALGYYYSHGSSEQLDRVARYDADRSKVPECSENAKDCDWRCGETEVETLGDYVKHCIVPAMAQASGPSKSSDAKASQDPQKTK